jgi:hypothetical protein
MLMLTWLQHAQIVYILQRCAFKDYLGQNKRQKVMWSGYNSCPNLMLWCLLILVIVVNRVMHKPNAVYIGQDKGERS